MVDSSGMPSSKIKFKTLNSSASEILIQFAVERPGVPNRSWYQILTSSSSFFFPFPLVLLNSKQSPLVLVCPAGAHCDLSLLLRKDEEEINASILVIRF